MNLQDIKNRLPLKTAGISLSLLLVAAFVGTSLLFATFLLPDSRIVDNVKKSTDTFLDEGYNHYVINKTVITRLDNYTDALMLNTASCSSLSLSLSDDTNAMSGKSTLDRALLNPRVYRDNKQIDTLKEIKNGTATNIRTYARYWHGYITYLRPLLFFYDYNLIRLVLFAVHLSLSAAFIVLVNKKLGTLPTIAFVCAYVLSGSFVTPFSLQYFNVMTVTQVSGIVLLKSYNFLHKKGWLTYFFLLTGIVTVYFDLLTFPVVSLGVNLVLPLLLDRKIGIKQILLMTFMWCVGYVGMWILKWTIATIFTNENVFVSAMQNADKRSGSTVEGVGITYLDVLKRNVGRYHSKALLIPYVIVFLLSFVPVVKNRSFKINKSRALCFAFICALPFMWYALLQNHSYVHSWFTFRTLIPALIALMLLRECFEASKT